MPRDGVNCCSRKGPSRVTANKTIYKIYLPLTYSIASEHDKCPVIYFAAKWNKETEREREKER